MLLASLALTCAAAEPSATCVVESGENPNVGLVKVLVNFGKDEPQNQCRYTCAVKLADESQTRVACWTHVEAGAHDAVACQWKVKPHATEAQMFKANCGPVHSNPTAAQ
jgi:hypothetical protein